MTLFVEENGRKPVIWDLCSGLGGWSEAFVQAGWEVIRIEIEDKLQHVPHTYQLDVLKWADWADDLPKPDLIVASPPCLEFSTAYAAPKAVAAREGREFTPDLSLLEACRDIIEAFSPTFSVIENVNGAISTFNPILGKYKQQIGPFYLWGNFPWIITPVGWDHHKGDFDVWSSDPLRSNKRALIPFEISFGLLKAVKNQSTLKEWV